eukprot:15062810-Alexandrium_andersonii.AAC.1
MRGVMHCANAKMKDQRAGGHERQHKRCEPRERRAKAELREPTTQLDLTPPDVLHGQAIEPLEGFGDSGPGSSIVAPKVGGQAAEEA